MNKTIDTDADFLRSLTPRQRDWFLRREQARQGRLQDALRELSRGLGTLGELHGEALALVLGQAVDAESAR